MDWHRLIGNTFLLYGLINPVGALPIYLHLLEHGAHNAARRVLPVAAAAVAGLLVIAAVLGQQVLSFFNVGIDDFRIAGGILALVIAFEMFQAHYGGFLQTIEERTEAEGDLHGVAVTPLAFPLLVGPAELSVMITLSNDTPDLGSKVLLVLSILLTSAFTSLTLRLAIPLSRFLG